MRQSNALGSIWALYYLLLSSTSLVVAQDDPLTNFCRRFGHQTTIIDGRLYVDGGYVNYGGSITGSTSNDTNTYLLFSALDGTLENQFPQMYSNLTKGTEVPSVAGGTLWADTINKYFYVYGGEYTTGTPADYGVWQYDALADFWSPVQSDLTTIPGGRAAYGASAVAEDLGVGYYLGGWFDNMTTPGWTGSPQMNTGFISYNMVENSWQNSSGPSGTMAFAEGTMQWIPASDGGMLVYFGGIQQPMGASNGSYTALPMSEIYIYDIRNNQWFSQEASGSVPPARRRFCAGAAWADDQSSYNIYLYGGLPATGEGVGYGDVYVLSLPSFEWIEYYVGEAPSQHHSCSANILPGNGQMMIIGGEFPNTTFTDCDTPSVWGQHNLALGMENVLDAQWYQYLPNLTTYQVPPNLTEVIGGSPTGGATLTTPSGGWGSNTILESYIDRKYATSTRSPTRSVPTTAATSTAAAGGSGGGGTNVGAIAGGVVGGVVGLILIVGIVWLCLRARRKRRAAELADNEPKELPAVSSPTMQQARSGSNLPGAFREHLNSPSDGRDPWNKPPTVGNHGGAQEMSTTNSPNVASPPPQFGSWSPSQQSTNWAPVVPYAQSQHGYSPQGQPQGQYGPAPHQEHGLGLQQTRSNPQQFYPPPPNPQLYTDPETRHEMPTAASPTMASHLVHEKDATGSSEALRERSENEKRQ